MNKTNRQQKELADILILVPPYAVVFQLKWLHQTAEDFHGANQEIERGRLEQKMAKAAKQFNRLHATWRLDSKIELPQVWNDRKNTFVLFFFLIKVFIPVVVIDFEDQQYATPDARTNVSPVVTKVPDVINDWGMVHCFLLKDFSIILDDLFTPGDLITYLLLRERQIKERQKFLAYSELDFFALYLTRYHEWNRSENAPMLFVAPNYYETIIGNHANDFTKRRMFFRKTDFFDEIIMWLCMNSQNMPIEDFLLNLGRIKGLPALLKKSIAEQINANIVKLANRKVNTTTQISIGRFSAVVFPHTLYLISVVLCEPEYVETVKDYLYLRALSYVVEKDWQPEVHDVFMIILGLPNRWVFVGNRVININDYGLCLTAEEIEKSRVSYDVELFEESEWSYLKRMCGDSSNE